jgi:flagellar basal-body rod modification protein FlgD
MSVSSIIGAGEGARTQAGDAFSRLSSEEFTKIILTELQNQDPLQPNDTGALLEQLSSIRSIQSDMELATRLESIVGQNELAGASGLIGKRVSGLSEGFARVTDEVVSVSRTSDGSVLNLKGGLRMPMKNLDEILSTPAPVGA